MRSAICTGTIEISKAAIASRASTRRLRCPQAPNQPDKNYKLQHNNCYAFVIEDYDKLED
jgi:hypothetical protein